MPEAIVFVHKFTRREFREACEAGKVKAVIIPVGSNEQHLEHLAMEHDIRSSTWVAERAAVNLHPQVVVAVPMAIGISEHHMVHKGSLSAKPGGWLSVLFDTVENFVRHGINQIYICNGHGGNVAPVRGVINQWLRYFAATAPQVNLLFNSYWDLIPREISDQMLKTKRMPGHAQEFETSFAMYVFPENIRHDALIEEEAVQATREAGRVLAEEAVTQVTAFVRGMIEGRIKSEITGL